MGYHIWYIHVCCSQCQRIFFFLFQKLKNIVFLSLATQKFTEWIFVYIYRMFVHVLPVTAQSHFQRTNEDIKHNTFTMKNWQHTHTHAKREHDKRIMAKNYPRIYNINMTPVFSLLFRFSVNWEPQNPKRNNNSSQTKKKANAFKIYSWFLKAIEIQPIRIQVQNTICKYTSMFWFFFLFS